MKIVILDRESIGFDTPLSVLNALGEVTSYDITQPHQVFERIAKSDVVILNKVKITEEIIQKSKNLKLICVFATGFDNIDVAAARANGVSVCNVPAYSTDSVTAWTVSTVLALSTRLREYNDYVSSGEYTASGKPNLLTPVFHDISGKVWGIIGCGDIGSSVARVATALGARVVTYQRHPHPIYDTIPLDELCSISDIITVHCPLNAETKAIINSERLQHMKKSVILVNAARGAVLDESAVAKAVKDANVGFFGCDVYSVEPFTSEHPYYELKDASNVILTPHCAWGSFEAREKCINIIADNIASFADGKIKNRVDI